MDKHIDITNIDDVQELGPSQRIFLDGQVNFRDLGGFRTTDGRTLKSGIVYRSGELSFLSNNDQSIMTDLGIKSVIDLRTNHELATRGPDRIPDGIEHRHLPIEFGDLDEIIWKIFGDGDMASMPDDLLVDINRHILFESTHVYSELLLTLAHQTNLPLVFHCTHGKDRVGMGAAILLSALGASRQAITQDYLASNFYRDAANHQQLAERRSAFAHKQDVDVETIDVTRLKSVYYLRASYLHDAFGALLERFGSFDEYLRRGLGLTSADLISLRNNLLE